MKSENLDVNVRKSVGRDFALDLLRVMACYMVIHQHCAEQFYGSTGHVEIGDDTYFIGFSTALGRICVPLFAMLSGYLLLPMKGSASEFFKKRVTRILWPFLIWNAVYAVCFIFDGDYSVAQAAGSFMSIVITFAPDWSHMWYVYMLVGLYLLVPVISPWLEKVSKRQLRFYLALWVLTALLPYLNRYVNAEMWGLCFWNPTPSFYYFTGFAGYFILGFYIKRFGALSVCPSVLLIVVGYAVSVFFFIHDMFLYKEYADLEMSWNFCSLNIVMIAYGMFSLFTKISWKGEGFWGRLLSDVAIRSYGVYLAHMIVLLLVHTVLVEVYPELFQLVTGPDYAYHRIMGGVPAVLLAVPIHAIITMILVYVVIRLLGLVKTEDIHPPKTGISVHFCVLSLMAMQN